MLLALQYLYLCIHFIFLFVSLVMSVLFCNFIFLYSKLCTVHIKLKMKLKIYYYICISYNTGVLKELQDKI